MMTDSKRSFAGARPLVVALVAALVCLGLAAVGVRPASTTKASASPASETQESETKVCDGCTPPLVYEDGRVMGTAARAGEVTITPIYWGPSGAFPLSYRQVIDRYIRDVAVASGATDNVYSVGTEYYEVVNGVQRPINYVAHNGGEKLDVNAFPANGCAPAAGYTRCITDAQLRSQLNTFLTAHGLVADRSHFYPVFMPPNVEGKDLDGSTSASSWCGYHRAFVPSSGRFIVYGHEPYPTLDGCGTGQAPNGDEFADAAISTLSHEIMEAITDPGTPGAWADDPGGNEIADECSGNFGDPIDSTDPNNPQTTQYNQVINGDGYYTQEEFSNSDFGAGPLRGCIQREDDAGAAVAQPAAAPGVAPTATRQAAKPKNDIAVDAGDYTLPADGVSTTRVTVDVDDDAGNPVAGDHITLTTASDTRGSQVCGKTSMLSGVTDADGHLAFSYRASTDNISCDIVATEAGTGQSGDVTIDQGTADQNAPTVAATPPANLREGSTSTFTTTWTNPSQNAVRDTRLDVVLTGDDTSTTGLTASQVHLSYADESTGGQFRPVPLTDDTIADGEIDGFLPPLTGFTFPAQHTRTTTFRLSIDPGAPTSVQTGVAMNVELDFDQVNPADGDTTNLAEDDGDVWVAPRAPVCTSTVTGNVNGSYSVPAGQTACINGATIAGSVTVPSGAGAVITNSKVNGPVSAQSPTAFSLCGSTLGGTLTVSNASGFVLVGDPSDDACAANVIQGPISLTGNHAGAELVGNRIGQSLSLDSTTGRGPLADDRAPELESNLLGGNLECSGNVPAPIDDGHPNSVAGTRMGQCSASNF